MESLIAIGNDARAKNKATSLDQERGLNDTE